MQKYYVYKDMIGKNHYTLKVPKGEVIEFVREIVIFDKDDRGEFKDNLIQFKFDNHYLQVPRQVFIHSAILLDLEHIQKCFSGEYDSDIPKDQLERLMVKMI